MSTQTENPVNGNISEIIKEINTTSKMNDVNIDCLEGKLSNGIKSSQVSEISENFVLDIEKCQENKENDSSIAKLIDTIIDNGIINKNQSEKNANATITEEIKESNEDKNDDHLESKKPDVNELCSRNVATDELTSTNIEDSVASEAKTYVTETNNKDADLDNALNSPDNEKDGITDVVLENTVNELDMHNENLHNCSNDVKVVEETKAAETSHIETEPKTSVEITNLITSNGSCDIEMTEIAANTVNIQQDAQVMQSNHDNDTNEKPVKSPEINIAKNNYDDSLVLEPELPLASNENKAENNDIFDIEPKDVADVPLEIDERVSKITENSKDSSVMSNERNVENESMEIDSEVANTDTGNFMETEDTECMKLKDISAAVNLGQNDSVKIDGKNSIMLEKDNKTDDSQNDISVETKDIDLVNSEKENMNFSHSIEDPSSTVIDCYDIQIKSKAEEKGDLEVIGGDLEEKESEKGVIICEDTDTKDTCVETPENDTSVKSLKSNEKPIEGCQEKDIIDEDDVKIVEKEDTIEKKDEKKTSPLDEATRILPVVCKLSNSLDILSDEEEEAPKSQINNAPEVSPQDKQSLNVDEDDDVMFIEEDSDSKKSISNVDVCDNSTEDKPKLNDKVDLETGENQATNVTDLMPKTKDKESVPEQSPTMDLDSTPETEKKSEESSTSENQIKPLLPQNFLKTAKKNLADMTRHELEDFCILRIVESIVDRSNLSDIKTKIKTMAQNLEEYRKKALQLTKQNRDLQVVLKSVQEEQKKRINGPIQPLKITRSVGMQVLMNDKMDPRRKAPIPTPTPPPAATSRPVRSVTMQSKTKPSGTPPNIPVPRKVPVNNSPAKALSNVSTNPIANKSVSPSPIAMRNPSPVQKAPEKRKHMQTTCSVTVDLTDDEPPAKSNKNSGSPPVRVVPSHNLLAQNRQIANNSQALNSPRKVYIPISGPQALRPQQQIAMKNAPGPRQRMNSPRAPVIRPKQIPRHPAPLPDAMKQYTPPTWKNLPPAPDLKLSKVENGIVISWKIDGYPDGAYETIASYQLYAYQETSAPPNTALWKKIGDVKALPLPMACTLTQFMAGFKYYFAVRAVDIRSRLGPFSLPGSILLLNKV